MELILSILVGLILIELYAWLPRFSEWLLEWAVRQLPENEQERYREEWKANLNDLPNSAAKLVHAVSHVVRAGGLTYQIVQAQCDEIDDMRGEVSVLYQRAAKRLKELEQAVAAQVDRQEGMLTSIEEARSLVAEKVSSAPTVVEHYNEISSAATVALVGFHEASKKVLDRWSTTFERIGSAIENHARATEVVRRRRYFFSSFDPALFRRLKSDIEAVSNDLIQHENDADLNDEFTFAHLRYSREFDKLMGFLRRISEAFSKP